MKIIKLVLQGDNILILEISLKFYYQKLTENKNFISTKMKFRERSFSSLASGKKSSLSFSLVKEQSPKEFSQQIDSFELVISGSVSILTDEINKIILSKGFWKILFWRRNQQKLYYQNYIGEKFLFDDNQ